MIDRAVHIWDRPSSGRLGRNPVIHDVLTLGDVFHPPHEGDLDHRYNDRTDFSWRNI